MPRPLGEQTASFKIAGPGDREIRSLDDWFRHAPPQSKKQWREGRSARELATAWIGPVMPDALANFFNAHEVTKGLAVEEAQPEHETRLDGARGERRNHDLLLVGVARAKKAVVGIEAKADEGLGDTMSDYLQQAKARKGKSTKATARLQRLTEALFGRTIDPELSKLRFQLVSGVAGTLIEARQHRATRAIFLVHEFHTDLVKPARVDANRAALKALVRAFRQVPVPRKTSGWLVGPIKVPGNDRVPGNVPLHIGLLTS